MDQFKEIHELILSEQPTNVNKYYISGDCQANEFFYKEIDLLFFTENFVIYSHENDNFTYLFIVESMYYFEKKIVPSDFLARKEEYFLRYMVLSNETKRIIKNFIKTNNEGTTSS